MNITELRYLVAIKKWGSVSAAAKQLYAAQPNVSKALKKLEEDQGIKKDSKWQRMFSSHPDLDKRIKGGGSSSRPHGCWKR